MNLERSIQQEKSRRRRSGCAICWSADNLQFHHVNPENKRFVVGDRDAARFFAVHEVLYEMVKCTILCHDCHKRLHEGQVKVPANELWRGRLPRLEKGSLPRLPDVQKEPDHEHR